MICAFIGCDRDAGDRWHCKTHQKQLLRRKNPDLLTPIGVPVEDVPPCRKCHGRNFSIRQSRYPDGRPRLHRYCLTCSIRTARKWIKANPERAREWRRQWREANPEKSREASRRWRAKRRAVAC